VSIGGLRIAATVAVALLGSVANGLLAGPIIVPGNSFESPVSPFVSINIDSWQKSPKPDWYVEGGGFLWTQLTGIFKNTTTTSSNHIDNCDGDQALWLFAVPEVGLFQDYDSVDWRDAEATHAFDARFEEGSAYELAAAVAGAGGGMLQGATLELSLYYRDGASNRVTVAATTLTNLLTVFSNNTHLLDFSVQVPTVRSSDAWAGRNIGILLLSTVDTNLQGGYWDVDNVRLRSSQSPVLQGPLADNGQFGFTLVSEPGSVVELLASTNLLESSSNWTSLGRLTNVTGTTAFVDTSPSFPQRFYRARQVP
jgi:hypothetical protein